MYSKRIKPLLTREVNHVMFFTSLYRWDLVIRFIIIACYMQYTGFPHIFKHHFPHFFNTKFYKFNTITSLNFSKFLIMKLNFTHCVTLHKCFAFSKILLRYLIAFPFRISIIFQYLMYILAKFNTSSRSSKPILKFNTFSILSIPGGNPECIYFFS